MLNDARVDTNSSYLLYPFRAFSVRPSRDKPFSSSTVPSSWVDIQRLPLHGLVRTAPESIALAV
jgi:hypothetical protein